MLGGMVTTDSNACIGSLGILLHHQGEAGRRVTQAAADSGCQTARAKQASRLCLSDAARCASAPNASVTWTLFRKV